MALIPNGLLETHLLKCSLRVKKCPLWIRFAVFRTDQRGKKGKKTWKKQKNYGFYLGSE